MPKSPSRKTADLKIAIAGATRSSGVGASARRKAKAQAGRISFKCPNCQTRLYSRVHRVCRTCGVALPAELLLPEADIRHFEEKTRQEKKAKLEADKNIDTSGPDINAIGGASVQ